MKAIVYRKYGSPDVLVLEVVERPLVGDHDVLIRVRAASLNALDWHFVTGTPYLMRLMVGLVRPKRFIPGVDLAGTVEFVGSQVSEFEPGDEVFGYGVGSCAELVAAPANRIAHKPVGLTFEQAAAVPVAAVTALQGLRDQGQVRTNHKVLINGAAGGVGTFAVQIAKALGAEVTGVCSAQNVEIVRSIGADHVVDYTEDDFATGGQRYDVMLDNVGNRSLADCRKVLTPDGVCVVVSGPKGRLLGPLPRLIRTLLYFKFQSQRAVSFTARASREELLVLSELLETGRVVPVIERTYGLAEVPHALRYLGAGHARGKLVIRL